MTKMNDFSEFVYNFEYVDFKNSWQYNYNKFAFEAGDKFGIELNDLVLATIDEWQDTYKALIGLPIMQKFYDNILLLKQLYYDLFGTSKDVPNGNKKFGRETELYKKVIKELKSNVSRDIDILLQNALYFRGRYCGRQNVFERDYDDYKKQLEKLSKVQRMRCR